MLAATPALLGRAGGALPLGLLQQTVPMAGFSPFQSLAGEQRDQEPGTSPGPSSGRLQAPELRPIFQTRSRAAAAEAGPGPAVDPPPVFSFRRPVQGVPETRDTTPDQASGVPFGAAVANNRTADESLDSTTRISARQPDVPAPGGVKPRDEWAADAVAASHPAKTIDLLDALTSKLMRVPAVAGFTPNASNPPRHAPVVSSPASALWAEAESTAPGAPPPLPPRASRLAAEAAAAGRAPIDVYAMPGAAALDIRSDGVPDLPGKSLPRQSSAATGAPSGGRDTALDAETVASMVNEVLAEQARRHGVDLS